MRSDKTGTTPADLFFNNTYVSVFFLSNFLLSMYMSVHSHNSQIENSLAVYYRTLRVSYVKYLLHCYSKMDGISGFRLKPSTVFGYSLFKKYVI